ncbi:ABC transporter substrate-binding protein [Marinobacter salexigens]|uniref:Probable sugar-binding periplasmic protein n=1 Tax=Marinobacter salexigens TaxID=1925763 RepID=A0ABS6A9M2_9GAMM|nr:ABC transporter substrate-binding protein [Marinobacter salexigens]MBU2874652.1 ABC transporter substrate-binding protein [Marinobacter salexigens]
MPQPRSIAFICCFLLCATAAAHPSANNTVDILHWWVSEGEENSIGIIQRYIEKQGLGWHAEAVAGSGTYRFSDELRKRVASGNPPMASQAIGYDIRDWARQGKLLNLDNIAEEYQWDEVIPFAIQHLSKYQGHWVGVPINTHSTNWLWVNHAQLTRLGLKQPDTWPDLINMLNTAKASGLIPIAIGREAWEHTLLFESVAAGAGGAEFYRRVFLDLDPTALDMKIIDQIFQRMSMLRNFLDAGAITRNWNQATELVLSGQALLQVQGSWVDGEFNASGLVPGRDYDCYRFPDTQGLVLFNSDQYILFKDHVVEPETRNTFVKTLMDVELQRDLNIATGAAPARVDVPRADFNQCGQQAINDMRAANMRRAMLGSIAMGNANPGPVKNALYKVISDHLMGHISNSQAVSRLAQIISQAPRP